MKVVRIAALAATCVVATQAYASGPTDPVIVAPPVVVEPASDWTGFYLGLQAGSGNLSINLFPISLAYTAVGGHVGYLHDMGSFVLGAELNAERVNLSIAPVNITRTGLDLIAGYDMGNLMPFATLGAARLSAAGANQNGTAVAVGLAARIGENVFVTGKYRYSTYNLGGGARLNAGAFVAGASYQF